MLVHPYSMALFGFLASSRAGLVIPSQPAVLGHTVTASSALDPGMTEAEAEAEAEVEVEAEAEATPSSRCGKSVSAAGPAQFPAVPA